MKYWWTDYPWRYIQTNLREIDMIDIDAAQYVAQMQKFQATIAMINTSGILASYPTELPLHTQRPFLKGDSLASIIEACHQAGIKVIARTDFSKIRRPVYEQHPEWAYLSPEGKIVDYNGDVHACINGGFQQEYMLEIIRETLAKLDVDGIFFNMGGYQVTDYSGNYYGICHCDACKRMFYDQTGHQLPAREDANDPVYRQYQRFKQETSDAHSRKVCAFIRSIRPDILINFDTFTLDTGYIRHEANTALDRPLPHWPYSASEISKWIRGSYPGYRASTCDVDFIDFPVRHVAISPAQQELRLVQGLANGAGLDYYLIGRLDNHQDQSGFDRIRRIFAFHRDHEDLYKQPDSVAEIALIRPEGHGAEYRGWYRALTEGHFLFDVVASDRLGCIDLGKYRLLVLPDHRILTVEDAARIDRFTEQGGTIVCSGQTGLRDEDDQLRERPALQAMGVVRHWLVRPDCRSAMFRIRPDERTWLNRFGEHEELIFMDGAYVFNEYMTGAERRLAYIPPHHFGPPERCYYDQVTDLPGFVCNRFGQGKAITIPWYPGALLHRQGYLNTWNFLVSLLEHVADDLRVKGSLSPMVEVTAQIDQTRSCLLLSLVNGTGHFGVSFFDPVPLARVCCQIRVDRQPRTVSSLVDGSELQHDYDAVSGWLSITFDRLDSFDVAAIRF